MPLHSDLREFVALLNSNEVEYLVVGGYAVAYHGYPRLTKDIDILVNAIPENAAKLENALIDFGFESVGLTASDFTKPNQIIQLGYPPNRIDLLTSINGVDFEQAWQRRVEVDLEGVPSKVIGREDLISSKLASGRPQDLADARKLQRRRRST